MRRTLHVPSENKLLKPQNTAIPGAKQVKLMIIEKAKGIQKSLTESVCLTNILSVSVNAKSSPFPVPLSALMNSLTYFFYEASGHLISCLGVKYKLNDFLIISDVLFLSHCFLHR